MRLRRLDLTRFGHFTDFSLDFGACEPGKADLHIIFGPNEAGKTTAFEAYLDLLFGIHARSQYDFLHGYDNMRIGACLEIDGAEHELVRIKKQQNNLLDASGNPVNPAILARALRRQIADLQRRITLRLGQDDFDAALEILENTNIPTATASLRAVEADLAEASSALEGAIGDLRAARDALAAVGGDDAVARLQEQRQVLLLDMAEQARKSLRLRLGILLAEQALSRYRDTHRSGMLAATQKAFTRLTAGRYTKLAPQSDGQSEVLLAVRDEDNRSISAAKMSKGTRFQLYLALRLAGYGQLVADGTILPFIADDILETFDNTRTSAALDLLGEVSLSGQALYFTHHEHVVDLARARLGEGCQIHNLSPEQ